MFRACLPRNLLLTRALPAHKMNLCPSSHITALPSMIQEVSLLEAASQSRSDPKMDWFPGIPGELSRKSLLVHAGSGDQTWAHATANNMHRASQFRKTFHLNHLMGPHRDPMDRQGRNHPCSRDEEPGEAQGRWAVPRVTQRDLQAGQIEDFRLFHLHQNSGSPWTWMGRKKIAALFLLTSS